MIKERIKAGKIVPSEITVGLLKKAIKGSEAKICLIDGFPRNDENYQAWMKEVGESMRIRFVLKLECSMEEMQRRVLERGKDSGRDDDNIEVLKSRYQTF